MTPGRLNDVPPFGEPAAMAADAPPPGTARQRRPGRLTTWILVGSLAVGACGVAAGLVWWGLSSPQHATAPEDVPVVSAGETPIKERPADPGGLRIAHRDKLVYRRIGDDDAPPPVERLLPPPEEPQQPPPPKPAPPTAVPPPERAPEAAAEPVADPPPEAPAASEPAPDAAAPPPAGGYQVQLASVRTEAEAVSEWQRLRRRHPELLGSLEPDVSRVELGERGTWYRVRGGPIDEEIEALALCAALEGRNADCLVVRPDG